MMNELQIFENQEFGKIRGIEINGESWLVGKDVAEALGYINPQKAIRDHVDEEDKTVNDSFTVNGTAIVLINESGVYSLVLSSKLPNAKKLKRWVTSEVLPSIRRHGAYMTPETLEAAILNPDIMIKLCTALKEEQDKRKALEAANSTLIVDLEIARPKADYFDQLVDRNLLTNFTEASKEIGIKRSAFIAFMLEHHYLYRDKKGNLLPYANSKTDGLFEVKQSSNQKTGWTGCQTLLTPKGLETFRLLCM